MLSIITQEKMFVFSAQLLPKACWFNGYSNAQHQCFHDIWGVWFVPTSGRWSRLEETKSVCTSAGPLWSLGDSWAGAAEWKHCSLLQVCDDLLTPLESVIHLRSNLACCHQTLFPSTALQKCIVLFLSWTLCSAPWTYRTPLKQQHVHAACFMP